MLSSGENFYRNFEDPTLRYLKCLVRIVKIFKKIPKKKIVVSILDDFLNLFKDR